MTFEVDPDRLADDWHTLSTFRDPALPGWTRRPFTEPYRAARTWLAERMRAAGLATEIDAGGNLIGRRAGGDRKLAPIVVGSHSDTVTGGGRFDGVLGVLAGIEIARGLTDLRHPLEVIDFLAEEPTDFGVSTVGSRALAGALTATMLRGGLADAITSVGGRPDALPGTRRKPGSIGQYLELHIEQGPLLENEGRRLGVVTGITGICRFHVVVEGRADHAGTTPMALRQDALAASSEVVLALEALWQAGGGVGTVGRLKAEPNATNVVPGRVELWAEMRSVDAAQLARGQGEFPARVAAIAQRRGLKIDVDMLSFEAPVAIDSDVQHVLGTVLEELGQPARRLASYAGHDANQIAKIAPIGMLFVPSRHGRSHCPEEWTDLTDAALGAQALGQAVLKFDALLSV